MVLPAWCDFAIVRTSERKCTVATQGSTDTDWFSFHCLTTPLLHIWLPPITLSLFPVQWFSCHYYVSPCTFDFCKTELGAYRYCCVQLGAYRYWCVQLGAYRYRCVPHVSTVRSDFTSTSPFLLPSHIWKLRFSAFSVDEAPSPVRCLPIIHSVYRHVFTFGRHNMISIQEISF